MTQAEEINHLKERVAQLESSMDEVLQMLGIGRVDDQALQEAIRLMLDKRDISALDRYLKHGGKIPAGARCAAKSVVN
jgi:hypothetical protein